jgi:hypothetical protein
MCSTRPMSSLSVRRVASQVGLPGVLYGNHDASTPRLPTLWVAAQWEYPSAR